MINYVDNPPDSNIFYANRALQCYEKREQWEGYTDCLNRLAAIHYYQENQAHSLAYAEQALSIAEQKLSPESNIYAMSLNNLGVFSKVRGDYKKAIQLYSQSAKIKEKYATIDVLANTYGNMGITYRVMGDYDEGIRYLEKALKLKLDTFSVFNKAVASNYADLARCYKLKGNSDMALKFFKKSLHSVSGNPSKNVKYLKQTEFLSYQNMADIYVQKEKLDSSYYFAQRAINIQEQYQVIEDFRSYSILAQINSKKQNYNSALNNLNKALSAVRIEYNDVKKHGYISEVLAQIAWTHHKNESPDSSLFYYQEALQAVSVDFDESDILKNPTPGSYVDPMRALEVLTKKADVLRSIWQSSMQDSSLLRGAYLSYQSATQLIHHIRQSHLTMGAKHQLAENSLRIFEPAIATAMDLHALTENQKYLERALHFAESSKAGILADQIQDSRARTSAGIPDSLLENDKTLRIDLAYIQTKLNNELTKTKEIDSIKIEELKTELFRLQEEQRQLTSYLEEHYEQYKLQKKQVLPVSIASVQRALKNKKTAIVEYFVGDTFLYVFLISHGQFKVWKKERTNEFDEAISSILNIIQSPPESNSYIQEYNHFIQTSRQLYQLLLEDIYPEIQSNIDHLVIIPADVLNALPFEVLLTSDSEEFKDSGLYAQLPYLIKSHQISYQYSAALFSSLETQSTSETKGLFAGFAPEFDQAQVEETRECVADHLYSLQCNQQEVHNINDLMKGTALLADKANTTSFYDAITDYRIVHLATHACLDQDNYQFNQIYFSDGAVSSLDLGNHEINAELAVLSACNTARGTVVKGEGTMSLSREFTISGCPSTVMSLWSVDDCAASDILHSFYTYLKKGETKDGALAQAKLAYLKSADKEHTHPYYWSAFIQSGQYEAMFKKTNYWLYLISALVLSLIFLRHFYAKKSE